MIGRVVLLLWLPLRKCRGSGDVWGEGLLRVEGGVLVRGIGSEIFGRECGRVEDGVTWEG